MSVNEPLKFGSKETWGETTCGYGLDTPLCSKPAVWHLYWMETNSLSSTCAEHLNYINERPHPVYDIHTHGPNCGMPGALWHFAYEDEPEGYCFFPACDDASAMEAETLANTDG